MTPLSILLIPFIFIIIIFIIFMIGLTYAAFVWEDKSLVIMCAIFWAAVIFSVFLRII